MIDKLKADVDEYSPTVIYAQVSWGEDYQTSPGHDNLIEFMSEQEAKGTTCIVADSRHTVRWGDRPRTKCVGDLAFQCNDQTVLSELEGWASEKDGYAPRCVEDLGKDHVAECLAGIAEAHHIEKCVDAAFVGTVEAWSECNRQTDGIVGPEDEAVKLDKEEDYDDEEMLEALPLPCRPEKRIGKEKWHLLPHRARIAYCP